MAGLEEPACESVGSEGIVLFNFALEKLKAEVDFLFVRPFGVDGAVGLGFELLEKGVAEDADCWSMIEAAGVSSVEVVMVVASGSGRGGGGETLLRG
jgi:hypothetical protein